MSVPASFLSGGFAPSSRKVDSLHYCKPKFLHKKHCCSVLCTTKLRATHDGLTIKNSDLNAVVESISCSLAGPFLTRLTLQWCPYCCKDPAAPQPIPTPRGSTAYCQSNTSSMPLQHLEHPSRLPCKDSVAPQQFQHTPKNTVSQKHQPKHQNHRTTKPTDMVSKWPTSWGKPS